MIATEIQAPESSEDRDENTTPARNLWRSYSSADHGEPIENELVMKYLPLVKSVVNRIALTLPKHIDLDSLISPGTVGLLAAIRNYDQSNGNSFETYARYRIRGAVLDELRRLDWVPRGVHEKARRVQRVVAELEQEKGRVPTEEEMAEAMTMNLRQYRRLLDEIQPVTFVTLDSVSDNGWKRIGGEGHGLPDRSQDDPMEATARRELVREISDRIEQLPEALQKVLALYYFEDLRLREIAEIFGVTESRICQIHSQAIRMIRNYFQRQENRVFG